jgi:hypothetical protein
VKQEENEADSGYYVGVIVCARLDFTLVFECLQTNNIVLLGIDLLPRTGFIHPAVGKALGSSWETASVTYRRFRPYSLHAIFRTFNDLRGCGDEQSPCGYSQWERRDHQDYGMSY